MYSTVFRMASFPQVLCSFPIRGGEQPRPGWGIPFSVVHIFACACSTSLFLCSSVHISLPHSPISTGKRLSISGGSQMLISRGECGLAPTWCLTPLFFPSSLSVASMIRLLISTALNMSSKVTCSPRTSCHNKLHFPLTVFDNLKLHLHPMPLIWEVL
jgi:hypothetical protein